MRTRAWAEKVLWFVLGLVTAGGLTLIPSLYGGTSAQQEKESYRDRQARLAGGHGEKNQPCEPEQKEQKGPRN